jgi:hypothetical protein
MTRWPKSRHRSWRKRFETASIVGRFREDPIPECCDLRHIRYGFRADNPVGIGHPQRRVFERVVSACIAGGLVGGEGFAVDASPIEADANRQRSVPGSAWSQERDPQTASRAVKEYLSLLNDAAWGGATEVVPKFVSPSDPTSQWTGAMKGRPSSPTPTTI